MRRFRSSQAALCSRQRKEPEWTVEFRPQSESSGRRLGRLGICLVSFASCVYGCTNAGGLILHQVLAAFDEVFPLCPATIYNFASAADILTDLFLAFVDDLADLLRCLTSASTQIFRPFTSTLREIFPSFATALRGIQNAD